MHLNQCEPFLKPKYKQAIRVCDFLTFTENDHIIFIPCLFPRFVLACSMVQYGSSGSDQPWIQLICLTTLCDDNGQLQYGRFHCPILIKTSVKVVVPSSQLQQQIHIVHNCSSGQCEFELTRHGMVEEREESNVMA